MLTSAEHACGTGVWRYVGASVTGSGHETHSMPCQDAHRIFCHGEVVAIAVSDGAGSAPRSEIGSQLAVSTAVAYLSEALVQSGSPDPRGAVEAAREAVLCHASELEVAASELACTLLVLLLKPGEACAAQIGDGSCIVGLGEEFVGLTKPQNGEYANATNFLTGENALSQIQEASLVGEITFGAAITDGLQPIALDLTNGDPFGPFWDTMRGFLCTADPEHDIEAELFQFLSSHRVRERCDDDLTLAMVGYCPPREGAE